MSDIQSLNPVQQKFILHWGEMGIKWGINRTEAQIHALLYLSPKPLNFDEIVHLLGVARSNVSNSLKDLQSWGIVKRVHVLGDKRDHFESMKDVWEMFRLVMDERKRREIDPTLLLLKDCIAEAEKSKPTDKYTMERLKALNDFFAQTSMFYTQMRAWPAATFAKLAKLGQAVVKLVGG